jgi:hypothetical protein
MPFDGSGNYVPPGPPTFPAVDGTVIRSDYFNTVITDLATSMSLAVTKDGQTTPTGYPVLDSSYIRYLPPYTGSQANNLESKTSQCANLLDFIPASQHAAIKSRTSTYEVDSDILTALSQEPWIEVSDGRYNIGDLVEIGAGGFGQTGLVCQGGVEFARLDTLVTTPLFWLKSSESYLIGVPGSSKFSTVTRSPDGLILVGQRNMTTAQANVLNCNVAGFKFTGQLPYGQTSGSPDTAMKVVGSQLTPAELAVFFNNGEDLFFENFNYGLHTQGFANGGYYNNIRGQYIGNSSLPNDRALIYFDGAQENTIGSHFLHYSPGSTCIKWRKLDNTANPGGQLHKPILNLVLGQTEQDPGGASGGIGIDMPDSAEAQNNTVILHDNCPTNIIGDVAKTQNNIRLLDSEYTKGRVQRTGVNQSTSFIATGNPIYPNQSILALYLDEALLQGVLRCIHDGVAWRRLRYEAQDHRFYNEGALIVTVEADGVNLESAKTLQVNGTQVVSARDTGWTAMTGSGSKGALAAAAAGTASAGYVQAELQTALNRIAALEARMKSYDAALVSHGLIGA